jgi:hypothetical protein
VIRLASILDFETPTGQKGNVLKPMSWVPLILGSLVLLTTFSAAQKLGAAAGNKLPFVDSTPNSPWQVAPVQTVQNSKMYIG